MCVCVRERSVHMRRGGRDQSKRSCGQGLLSFYGNRSIPMLVWARRISESPIGMLRLWLSAHPWSSSWRTAGACSGWCSRRTRPGMQVSMRVHTHASLALGRTGPTSRPLATSAAALAAETARASSIFHPFATFYLTNSAVLSHRSVQLLFLCVVVAITDGSVSFLEGT